MGVWVDTSERERKRAKANLSSNASYSSRKPATLASTAKEEKAAKKKRIKESPKKIFPNSISDWLRKCSPVTGES